MSGGDEQPDDAADEPAGRTGDGSDDAAADDGAEDPVDDADRDRPDSPHRDPHTADDESDEADETNQEDQEDEARPDGDDADGDGDDADGDHADRDEEGTSGVGSGGSTEDANGSPDQHADVDDADAGAGMPDWEEKQWGPHEAGVDDADEHEAGDERPYDPAFDDTVTDSSVATAEFDGADDGSTDEDDGSTDEDEGSTDEDDGNTDEDDVDPSGTIEAVDRDGDAEEATAGEGAESFPIERFDPETVGLTTEADDDFDTTGGAEVTEVGAEEGAASDGGTVAVGEGNTIGGAADEYDGGFGGFRDGPEYDQEMPLADHIEEMMTRLLTVIVVMAVVSAPAFLFADTIINFVWDSILGAAGSEAKPHVYRPLSLVLARLKTATLAGFIIALPVFVYQTYLFMRPGLYPKERRYYLAAVPTSLVLASVGVLFAFYLVLPAIFVYFVTYSKGAAVIAFGLTDTYGLMLTMMGFFALIFQIPLFIMLAIMMGLTTRKWLADRRILFWGAFAGLSAMFAFDPTGMAPIIVALTMIVLFEGTLFLLRWVERGKAFFARRESDPDSDV